MTLGFGQLLSFIDGVPSPWNIILKFLLIVAGIVGLLASTVRFVPQGYEAMRTRGGKVIINKKTGLPIILRPGLRFIVPKFYAIVLVDSRDRTFKCGPTQIQYGQYFVVNVTAVVTLSLYYAYDAEYRVGDLNERVFAVCTATLRDVFLEVPDGDIKGNMQQIRDSFAQRIGWLRGELGLKFKALDITDVEYIPWFTIAGALHAAGAPIAAFSSPASHLQQKLDTRCD